MTDAKTLDGLTLDQIVALVAELVERGLSELDARPPAARHNLTTHRTATVVAVDEDEVVVQLDSDAPGVFAHCSPGGPATPQQRGVVLCSPSGGMIWIGGSPAASAPTPVQPATPYPSTTAATLAQVGNGTLEAVFEVIGDGPLVFFSIELIFGTTTGLPTFVLPIKPATRRHIFAGSWTQNPGGAITPLSVSSGADGRLTLQIFRTSPDPAPEFAVGGTLTNCRVAITGVYEAQLS